ncbi:glucans biosynthesis glucosyltransferase MdoH [Kushneria phosphatilytica]|uniref:Glucans biosynthesis glucosyltransferase H n=1 Tax=Kushneria phosphatilytica TaxID=657387 RepID=A0A5C0ZY16_9GAMM|nr:glucans biosynthesis glucosyltransferase MdoH [Kushneria phosphatilytica]QEL10764.1 glucans biosynthesis glucosyltransferase MdoH [Kushneria phosphatilytica]
MVDQDSYRSPARTYLERLALGTRSLSDRRQLLGMAEQDLSFEQVHAELGGGRVVQDDPASASVLRRLELAYGSQPLAPPEVLTSDRSGRVCLKTMPPISRTPLAPQPWTTSPFKRIAKGIQLRRGTRQRRQRKRSGPEAPSQPRWQMVGSIRRWTLVILTLAQSAMAAWYMSTVLPYQGARLLEVVELVLFALLFCWVSSGFWTALMGFFQLLKGRDRYSISASAAGDEPIGEEARTAIVMPICNEDVKRVFAGLKATYESVQRTGYGDRFEFHVLSDTYDPDLAVEENHAWLRLCREVGGFGRIFYRRRQRRVKRKSGNIDDFCRRFGARYRYMVVLDADSVMSGSCLKRLVQLMEANPDAGIIQSAPMAAGGTNLYARMQQFATRVYGPLFTAGLHFWQLGESHYWGHNAIIRVEPFMYYCSLAPLPGKGSLSGEILSHDFVEAALMRRAGWGVWIAYDLPGSYEEMPPNLLDELQRDRRWCQGNIMNFRLFLVRGMHPVHRAVFLTGVMSYLSAPLWFLFLALSTTLLALHTMTTPQYFTEPMQLFPSWPEWHPGRAVALFSTTMTLLFLPKILSVLLICIKGARDYGGSARVVLSMIIESLVSMLLAPVRMLFHTRFVLMALLGIEVKWKSPDRESSDTPWREAARRHGGQTLLGIAWTLFVLWLDPLFLLWLWPIVGALMLSIPVSVMTSKVGLGLGARRIRMFLIPEEARTPRELRSTRHNVRFAQRRPPAPGFIESVVNPIDNALACAMGVARHGHSEAIESSRQAQVRHALVGGPEGLSNKDRLLLLDDPVMLSRLHYQVWGRSDRYPAWLEAAYADQPEPWFS